MLTVALDYGGDLDHLDTAIVYVLFYTHCTQQ